MRIMNYSYKTRGTCSRQINIEIADDGETILNVDFIGGCNGNLKGIGALVKGKKIDEIADALECIDCNFRGTSCPDQLSKALREIQENS